MRNTSIVPEIINSKNIQILDENNIPVTICKPCKFLFNFSLFQSPYLLIDNIEKRRYKHIEIKRIELDDLARLGFRLVSLKANSSIRNRPRQSRVYLIESMDNPVPNSEVLHKIPKEHFLEMDIFNKRIRIRGNNSYPFRRNENASEWITIIEVQKND